MPQLVKKRRSGWALLAVSALVASLLAVGSAPAGAAEIKTGEDNKAEQSAKPTFSACVGEARDDYGFTDLGTLDAAVANINCLAYYGISAGKTADTFDPDTNVTRGQMALFLNAAAAKAGVDLMGGDGDDDFDDIAELGENRQNAIKALARNGIMSGSGGDFRPHADITRAEMAMALVNLVRHTAPSKFVQAGTDKGKLVGSTGAALAADSVDYFVDARRTVPVSVDTHISYAYELGITSGYPDATFRPNDGVPRRNMATFIMNALAHSNLRPAGLTVQSNNGQLTASLRNADFGPVDNELVDAFYVDATRESRAFNNDGKCRSIVKAVDGSTSSTCEIQVTDSATDADGNAPLNGLTPEQIGKGVTVWVWTGDPRDEVDEDTDLVKLDQGPVTSPSAATKITISPSQARTPSARFGTAVKFTGQLQYVSGGLDKDTSVGTDPDMGGAQYGLVIHVLTGTVDPGTAPTVANATGRVTAADADGDALGVVSVSASETHKTDADGKITFSLSTSDPSATSLTDTRTVVYVLTPKTNAPGAPATADADPERMIGHVVFGEAASAVTTVKVESIGSYAELPASASNPASHGVTVTVLDQYGNPMRNRAVTLSSSSTDSAMAGLTRSTGPTGSVRIFYNHSGTTQIVETVTATWDAGPGADGTAGTGDDPADVIGTATVPWAQRITTAGVTSAETIIAASLAEDEVVVTAATPQLLRYDDNDIFKTTVPGPGGVGTTTSYTDIEGFEALLATVVAPANLALADGTTGKRTGTLEWDGYDHDDEDARTLFTFVLTIA